MSASSDAIHVHHYVMAMYKHCILFSRQYTHVNSGINQQQKSDKQTLAIYILSPQCWV